MLSVYMGADRVAAQKAIQRALGAKYEVFEGEKITIDDLPSIFRGVTLFDRGERRILLKDLTENELVWERVADYVDTPHKVIIWETKIEATSPVLRKIRENGVLVEKFEARKPPEAGLVFGILDTALKDGPRAVKMVEKIEGVQDPYMFFGLMVSQAIKRFSVKQGEQERKILKMLAELDLQMKTSTVEPWTLIKTFLLRITS